MVWNKHRRAVVSKTKTKMKRLGNILILGLLAIVLCTCKKTYEKGPVISLRSKMNRITGKWRLVEMEGVERLHPEVEQYMELTKGDVAIFTNFQDEYCTTLPFSDTLYTGEGRWHLIGGKFGGACNPASLGEELQEKEGLLLVAMTVEKWKILRLTNEELEIVNDVCVDEACFYATNRRLKFEKE